MFALFAVLTSQLVNFMLIQRNQTMISVSHDLAFLIKKTSSNGSGIVVLWKKIRKTLGRENWCMVMFAIPHSLSPPRVQAALKIVTTMEDLFCSLAKQFSTASFQKSPLRPLQSPFCPETKIFGETKRTLHSITKTEWILWWTNPAEYIWPTYANNDVLATIIAICPRLLFKISFQR